MKFNNQKVLIVPLDWGLGHATRCIPLVRSFLQRGWEVVLGGEGAVAVLLQREFPELTILTVPGYRVRYSRKAWTLPVKLAVQVPRIMKAIRREHAWLQKTIVDHQINLVISDNRYGLYTESIPCIFITHQLQIKAPYAWMESLLKKINFKYISRFTACWVPDNLQPSLAGELSHLDEIHPFPVEYIGPLSRFKRQMTALRYKYLFLISGPEPQRTLFEQMVLRSIGGMQADILVVLGKPGGTSSVSRNGNIHVTDHLEGEALENAMNSAEYVICRSGYTTLMELAALNKRSILIPTPGQTEQEYLARHLGRQKLAYAVSQENLDLRAAFEAAGRFDYADFPTSQEQLDLVIDELLAKHFSSTPARIISR